MGIAKRCKRVSSGFRRQTDSAFVGASGPVEIVDEVLGRRLKTEKQNSNSTIVWNPWRDGAGSMSDFGADEWRRMLCVEGGNILDSAVVLGPQEMSYADFGNQYCHGTGALAGSRFACEGRSNRRLVYLLDDSQS